MFPEEDWGDFVKTPPVVNSFLDSSLQEPVDSIFTQIPPLPNMVPRSPSMPSFISQDPMSTLDFLGLSTPIHQDSTVVDQEKTICPEIESRSLYISNLPVDTSVESFRQLVPPTVPIKSMVKNDKTSILIEFFDLRHSNYFRHQFDHKSFNGLSIECRYAPPPTAIPHQKPPNNGTIVIFHLNPIITNSQLDNAFSAFGEIRQIRGTPAKPNQRFIEFFDTRCAASALKAMNGKVLLGSKISIEFSIPGGLRKSISKNRFN